MSFSLRFRIFHKIFRNYLIICINKKENKKIIFSTQKFLYIRKLPLSIFEIYLCALRNLQLHRDCINHSLNLIKIFPNSDIGYWHLVHSYISLGKIFEAKNVLKKYNSSPIYSKRIDSLCFGNKNIEKLIVSSKIDEKSKSFHLFFSDAGLIGQSLLNVKVKDIHEKKLFLQFLFHTMVAFQILLLLY